MKGEQYINRPDQYERVYKQGKSWANTLLVLKAAPNGLDISRWGLSVSRRVGKAVTRNKVKRRLREILRVTPLRQGWDIVMIARPAVANAKFKEVSGTVAGLLARARLLEKGPVACKE